MSTPLETLAQLAAGIVSGGIRVVDLTVPLEPSTPIINLPPPFANSKPFALQEISRYDERGPGWYWNNIECGEHTGTHFDAPFTGSPARITRTTQRTTFRSTSSWVRRA